MRRWAAGLAAGALALPVLVGCAPSPEPTPTPTGFADEDAAFAAAEATYRAYVDALNRVDLSDPETFEDVYRWTTGTHNGADRKTLTTYHADGYSVSGATITRAFTGTAYSRDSPVAVYAIACSDVSGVQLLDAAGRSAAAEDRPAVYQLRLEFVVEPTAMHELRLSDSRAVENTQCG